MIYIVDFNNHHDNCDITLSPYHVNQVTDHHTPHHPSFDYNSSKHHSSNGEDLHILYIKSKGSCSHSQKSQPLSTLHYSCKP